MTTTQTERPTTETGTRLEDLDRRRVLHPHQSGANPERHVMVRGRGSTVWDAHGREFLDASGGGNWLLQIGYGRAELGAAAAAQAAELGYFSGFFGYSNDRTVELAVKLTDRAPAGMRAFFTCGGSESVETTMKLARLYHHNRGDRDRTWILSRNYAYHGSTYGSGTLTGFSMMQDGVGPDLPHIEKITPPYRYRTEHLLGGRDLTDFLVDELERTIQRLGPGNVAAMIGEPVMGGGGVVAPPADYWPRVRETLSRYGILLIADEVVTAYGRTGRWFDSPERGMDADLIATAKGLTSGYAPLGAVLVRDAIAEAVAGENAYLFHGHTFAMHPLASAVALENLRILEDEGLLERSLLVGEWLRAALAPLAGLDHVGEVRVEGATAGIDLVVDKGTREPIMATPVMRATRNERGVIVRENGHNLLISPPFVMTEDEVGRTAEALHDVLSRLRPDGTVAGS